MSSIYFQTFPFRSKAFKKCFLHNLGNFFFLPNLHWSHTRARWHNRFHQINRLLDFLVSKSSHIRNWLLSRFFSPFMITFLQDPIVTDLARKTTDPVWSSWCAGFSESHFSMVFSCVWVQCTSLQSEAPTFCHLIARLHRWLSLSRIKSTSSFWSSPTCFLMFYQQKTDCHNIFCGRVSGVVCVSVSEWVYLCKNECLCKFPV